MNQSHNKNQITKETDFCRRAARRLRMETIWNNDIRIMGAEETTLNIIDRKD